jgi:hypothetical protein
LAAALLCQVKILMSLQCFNEYGEKRHEPFGADVVGGVPDQEQRMPGRLIRIAEDGALR